jgi:hypothetical protein
MALESCGAAFTRSGEWTARLTAPVESTSAIVPPPFDTVKNRLPILR